LGFGSTHEQYASQNGAKKEKNEIFLGFGYKSAHARAQRNLKQSQRRKNEMLWLYRLHSNLGSACKEKLL